MQCSVSGTYSIIVTALVNTSCEEAITIVLHFTLYLHYLGMFSCSCRCCIQDCYISLDSFIWLSFPIGYSQGSGAEACPVS